MVGEVARNKALAVVLGKVTVVDTNGKAVDLTGFVAADDEEPRLEEEVVEEAQEIADAAADADADQSRPRRSPRQEGRPRARRRPAGARRPPRSRQSRRRVGAGSTTKGGCLRHPPLSSCVRHALLCRRRTRPGRARSRR